MISGAAVTETDPEIAQNRIAVRSRTSEKIMNLLLSPDFNHRLEH